MKKILIVIFILLLTACKTSVDEPEQVTEFTFNGSMYLYSDTTQAGYDLFNGDGHLFEAKCEEECIFSFELDEDIYIVSGTSQIFTIKKNGATILIDGTSQNPTGTESPEWKDDIFSILEAYQK
jgi:hypothetical protein